jgi:HSP20 family molecular chaperone IbpA
MKKYDLSTVFGNVTDLFNDFMDDFDFTPTTFFNDYSWMKPSYKMEDKGDKYAVSVEYDENHDEVSVDVNTDKREITITVSSKPSLFQSCTYYGKYTMTVPKDCNLEAGWSKDIDKENDKMIISFEKSKQSADEKLEKICKNEGAESDTDYKKLYNKLLALTEKYDEKIKGLEENNDRLRKDNEDLAKKLSSIKSLFN